MRAWFRAVGGAAGEVADRPETWVPGALAWLVTVGWVAFVAGVVRPPSVAELTFFGARLAGSALWPWNVVLGLLALLLLLAGAVVLVAVAESVLLREGRVPGPELGTAVAIGALTSIPALLAAGVLLASLPGVAQAEFNAPETGSGPVLRTLLRLAPFAALLLVAVVITGALHAAAIRTRGGALGALRAAPGRLHASGIPSLVQTLASSVVRIGFVLVAATLLRVLWDPIGLRLSGGGIDLVTVLLLLGFVAIWLCLVLAGGALHAWGSASWTRLLGDAGAPEVRATSGSGMERPLGT